MENSAFHSLLRQKLITIPILTDITYGFLSKLLGSDSRIKQTKYVPYFRSRRQKLKTDKFKVPTTPISAVPQTHAFPFPRCSGPFISRLICHPVSIPRPFSGRVYQSQLYRQVFLVMLGPSKTRIRVAAMRRRRNADASTFPTW